MFLPTGYPMIFLTFLAACAAAAMTGVIFQPGAWYQGLKRPSFTPPDWVFPVVWTVLYVLVAWAGARLAVLPGSAQVMALWALQIALNTLWTPVFFGAHRLATGMAILAGLWLVVAVLTVAAFGLDPVAGLLLVPYLGWLTVAAALNWRVWRDNPRA